MYRQITSFSQCKWIYFLNVGGAPVLLCSLLIGSIRLYSVRREEKGGEKKPAVCLTAFHEHARVEIVKQDKILVAE